MGRLKITEKKKCQEKTMLIDAGNNADGDLLVQNLKKLNIHKIDYLIGTHPHEDHMGRNG